MYLHCIYTTLSVLVSVNTRDLVSYCTLLSGWVSCLMLGQLDCCGLRIHLVIRAHVSLALGPNRPWCMCCYMRLPIAFWDNQQISLTDSTKTHLYLITFLFLGGETCQIRIEISNYTGNKISVGVTRPSHIGQSVPCDGWHSISGTRVQHMCTESGIRAQGLITRVTASWQLTDNTGICSNQLTHLLMRSMCSWLITSCAAASMQ